MERLEAFFDAVMAILMTIMVLEIKAPETSRVEDLIKQTPYFIAFVISATILYIVWYNQSFLLKQVHIVSKGILFAVGFSMLAMALIPVATAWVSEFPLHETPEYFYFGCYVIGLISYYILQRAVLQQVSEADNTISKEIVKDTPMVFQRHSMMFVHEIFDGILLLVGLVGIHFFPVLGLGTTLLIAILWWVFDAQTAL